LLDHESSYDDAADDDDVNDGNKKEDADLLFTVIVSS